MSLRASGTLSDRNATDQSLNCTIKVIKSIDRCRYCMSLLRSQQQREFFKLEQLAYPNQRLMFIGSNFSDRLQKRSRDSSTY